MRTKKVFLRVESSKKALDRAFGVLTKPTKKYKGMEIISFPDFETLGRIITGARLELLHVVRLEKPKSIQELARMLKRDFKNVYQDLMLLVEFGLLDLNKAGPRKAATPVAKFNEIVLAA